eukprot:scaffold1927_cov333-Pavlova_lutheri.AAC.4
MEMRLSIVASCISSVLAERLRLNSWTSTAAVLKVALESSVHNSIPAKSFVTDREHESIHLATRSQRPYMTPFGTLMQDGEIPIFTMKGMAGASTSTRGTGTMNTFSFWVQERDALWLDIDAPNEPRY